MSSGESDDESGLDGVEVHDDPADMALLESAPLKVIGRLRGSSNATLLVEVGDGGLLGVYKPELGERPLWDFPTGLWRREIAAYELSREIGFGLVPPTVHRSEGPYGEGSLQRFVDARPGAHYFTILPEASPAVLDQLRRLCVFDLVINSADRKAGHCLIDRHERIWAIDNGLSFHSDLKVRTVIWDFAGEPLPDHERRCLEELHRRGVPDAVSAWLDDREVDAVLERTLWLLDGGGLPHDPTGRRHPWPLV